MFDCLAEISIKNDKKAIRRFFTAEKLENPKYKKFDYFLKSAI